MPLTVCRLQACQLALNPRSLVTHHSAMLALSEAALEKHAAVRVFACALAPTFLSSKSLMHGYALSHLRGILMLQLNPMASRGALYGLTLQVIRGRGVWEVISYVSLERA